MNNSGTVLDSPPQNRSGDRTLAHAKSEALSWRHASVGNIDFPVQPRGATGSYLGIFGVTKELVRQELSLPADSLCVGVSVSGNMLVKLGGQVHVVPQGSTFCAKGPQTIQLLLCRGAHDTRLWCVSNGMAKGLVQGATEQHRLSDDEPLILVHTKRLEKDAATLHEATRPGNPAAFYTFVALLAKLFIVENEVEKMPFEADNLEIDGPFGELVAEVASKLDKSWKLDDGADASGYSRTHFCRNFKKLVGYGFPELVETLRAQESLRMLLNTELDSYTIMSRNGFSGMVAFRQALKNRVGILPAELKEFLHSR